MPPTRNFDWPDDEVRWKYYYLSKKLNSIFHYIGEPSLSYMKDKIISDLQQLEPESRQNLRNRMNNAWRQHKKRTIDRRVEKIQRSFTMEQDVYRKLGEIAAAKRVSMGKVISTLINAEHSRIQKKTAPQNRLTTNAFGGLFGGPK